METELASALKLDPPASGCTWDELRRLALALPGVREHATGFEVMSAKGKMKGIAWAWAERVHPKRARVLNFEVAAIPTDRLNEKEALMQSAPDLFFSDAHYTGYPAVLVRLPRMNTARLAEMLADAWQLVTGEPLASLSPPNHGFLVPLSPDTL